MQTIHANVTTFTQGRTLDGVVRDIVGGHQDDFDLDGLTEAFKDAIDDRLEPLGITRAGDHLYAEWNAEIDNDELREAFNLSPEWWQDALARFDRTVGS